MSGKLSSALIARDWAAGESALEFARESDCTRGEAHRQLILGHVVHMHQGYGFAQTARWLAGVLEDLDDGLGEGAL